MAGCSPAEPASASPAGTIFTPNSWKCKPAPPGGGGIFDRRNGEISNGVDTWSASWDFSIGLGPKSPTLPPIDPENQVEYDADLSCLAGLDCTGGVETPVPFFANTGGSAVYSSGLRPPTIPQPISIKNLSWSYRNVGAAQELYAPDMSWAQLDLLEAMPQIDFSAPPQVQVVLPEGFRRRYSKKPGLSLRLRRLPPSRSAPGYSPPSSDKHLVFI